MKRATMVRLRDLGEWRGGNTPSKAEAEYWTDGTIPWLSPKDMKVDEIASSEDRVTQAALTRGRVSMIPAGSVLCVTRSGILAHTFPVAVARLPVTINQDLKALLPRTGVCPQYVAHFMRSATRRILKECSKHGTTVASIETNALLDFKIPLIDFAEQQGAVAEIEKQFSRLDEAVANLQRVKANVRRYQASVLSMAFSAGRFEGVPDATPDARNALPSGWIWTSYAAIGEVTTGATPATSNAANFGGSTPFFKPTDLDAGANVVVARQYLSATGLASGRRLRAGSVLVTCIGATIGKTGLARVECTTNQQINAVTPRPAVADSRFIYWWTVSPRGQDQIRKNASATTLPILNKSKFSALAVPLPPLIEQHRIVAEVDRRLSIVREVEAQVDANLKRAQALRQAVLTRAFAGELVSLRAHTSSQPPLALVPGTTTLRDTARLELSAEIVHLLHQEPTFGQRKHQKIFHLCEHIAKLNMLQSRYSRQAAGPADLPVLHANELMLKRQAWYAEKPRDGGPGHCYVALSQAGRHRQYLECFSTEQLVIVRRLIDLMRSWTTDRCEIFSTTYAAWNDLILLGQPVTDDAILHEVWDCWDDSKRRFEPQRWRDEIAWIRQQGFVPTGFGQPTRGPTQGMRPTDLFAPSPDAPT